MIFSVNLRQSKQANKIGNAEDHNNENVNKNT